MWGKNREKNQAHELSLSVLATGTKKKKILEETLVMEQFLTNSKHIGTVVKSDSCKGFGCVLAIYGVLPD